MHTFVSNLFTYVSIVMEDDDWQVVFAYGCRWQIGCATI